MKQIFEKLVATFVSWPLPNNSSLCRGNITNSFKVSLTFSKAPISLKDTPISLGGMTSDRSFFSNSFSVTTSYINKVTVKIPKVNWEAK